MKIETIRQIRNILLRTFAIVLILNLLMAAATFGLWDTWTTITSRWFHTPTESLGPLMVNFFTSIKFFAIFVLLAPALALHWTVRHELKEAG